MPEASADLDSIFRSLAELASHMALSLAKAVAPNTPCFSTNVNGAVTATISNSPKNGLYCGTIIGSLPGLPLTVGPVNIAYDKTIDGCSLLGKCCKFNHTYTYTSNKSFALDLPTSGDLMKLAGIGDWQARFGGLAVGSCMVRIAATWNVTMTIKSGTCA
jgi:hypothetical protein